MKVYMRVAVLVAIVLSLALTACNRSASVPPVTTPTSSDQLPFPIGTGDPAANFATQTAIAGEPLPALPTNTPEVLVATNTPAEGGAEQPTDPGAAVPTATTDPNAGGGTGGPDTGGEAPTVPLAPTPVVTRPETYTLQQGEWPLCIARRFDLDVNAFLSANGMNMNSEPAAGTTVRIPATGNWNPAFGSRALRQHPTTHTVAAGENVYNIACKFGDVTPEAILAVNGLASAADLQTGATINIP